MTTEEHTGLPSRVWCPSCDDILSTDQLRTGPDGIPVCARCGGSVVDVSDEDGATVRPPWHFKVLVVGTVGYLIYRVIWFIQWIHHR